MELLIIEPRFRAGDSVSLRSGGPLMTVESYDGSSVGCAWFDYQRKLERAVFKPETLVLEWEKPHAALRAGKWSGRRSK